MVFQNVGQQWCLAKEGRGPLCHQKPLGKAPQEAPKRDSKWQWVHAGAMAGAWRALVLAAGLAAMACVAQRQWGFEERVVAQALQLFNSGRQGQPLSRLREVLPAPRSNSTFKTLVKFRVKETVCLSERQQQPEPQQCAFRDGGEERDCTAASFTRGPLRILMVDCNPGPERQQEGLREKRSAPSPEGAASEIDSSQLPPVARDLYEKAKFDLISNLLRNF